MQFFIDSDYKQQAQDVLDKWQQHTGFELEEDNVVKLVARDVNNYAEIVQTGDNDYAVNYKGGELTRGEHIFTWNKEKKCFEYSFKDSLKSNSLTIVSEAMLKCLLFDISVDDTINNCNDIFRFQMISHLGSTYDKCVMKYSDNDTEQELQRNNRIYAGKKKHKGKIYKVKGDRYDSLANCPPNPIVDNKNITSIDEIDKSWYIKYTKQKISDFKGRKEVFMEEKLEKLKKDELIEMLKERMGNDTPCEERTVSCEFDYYQAKVDLLKKIDNFRKMIRNRNFVLDKALPNNLGGGEIYSIDQIYQAVQETALDCGLDFSFETVDVLRFDIGAFKPVTGAPQNLATVKCIATLTDINSGLSQQYITISQGSDSIDKAVSGASSYAFRNWFSKNFTPRIINGEPIKFGDDDYTFSEENVTHETMEQSKPTTPIYVAPEKKKEIVKEITSEPQKTNDKSDADKLIDLVYEYRELSGNQEYATKSLQTLLTGDCDDVWIMSATLKVQNKLDELKKEKGIE